MPYRIDLGVVVQAERVGRLGISTSVARPPKKPSSIEPRLRFLLAARPPFAAAEAKSRCRLPGCLPLVPIRPQLRISTIFPKRSGVTKSIRIAARYAPAESA